MPALRVLIAEDEPISATLMGLLVQQEGHIVCGTVTHGSEVQEAVQNLRPDVVLMDVHLADDISGISATRKLLHSVSVPVIVVSGTDNREEMEEIAESGALGFIKKPISADELRVNLRIATHHNEVMRKLRASELLHRSLFDNAAVGIYVCHPDGYFLASNQAFARMLGYAGPAELLRLVSSIDDQVYVDTGRRQELLQLLQKGDEVTNFESQVYGRDGDLLWVAEHLAPNFDENGVLQHYESVIINITDRKQAEAAMHLAYSMAQNTVDAIADYITVTDLDGNIIMSNKAFEHGLAKHTGVDAVFRPCACTHTDISGAPGENLFEQFLKDVRRNPTGRHEKRGKICIAPLPFVLDTTISQYSAPSGDIVGAVFVMRAEQPPLPYGPGAAI